jgi:hypothetical protein
VSRIARSISFNGLPLEHRSHVSPMSMDCSICGSEVDSDDVRVSVTPVEVRPLDGYQEGSQYMFHPECWLEVSADFTARFDSEQ